MKSKFSKKNRTFKVSHVIECRDSILISVSFERETTDDFFEKCTFWVPSNLIKPCHFFKILIFWLPLHFSTTLIFNFGIFKNSKRNSLQIIRKSFWGKNSICIPYRTKKCRTKFTSDKISVTHEYFSNLCPTNVFVQT